MTTQNQNSPQDSDRSESHSSKWPLILIAIMIPAILAVLTVIRPNHVSGPKKLDWIWASGEDVVGRNVFDTDKPWPGCMPNDVGLTKLRVNDVLWTACDNPNPDKRSHNVGFAKLDPNNGTGTLFNLPDHAPHLMTVAAALGPKDELAIVYASEIGGQIHVAFIGEDSVETLPISKENSVRILATLFEDDVLEIVYLPYSSIDEQPESLVPSKSEKRWPILAKYRGNKLLSETRFVGCNEEQDCPQEICKVFKDKSGWRLN